MLSQQAKKRGGTPAAILTFPQAPAAETAALRRLQDDVDIEQLHKDIDHLFRTRPSAVRVLEMMTENFLRED